MRIRKEYQVIPTNAKLENGDSVSNKNGYVAEYINNHSVVVSPTEPTTDRKKVWLQHTKNLFNKSVVTKGYLTNEGVITSHNNWVISDYMPVNAGKKYTYQGLTVVGTSPYSAYYDSSKTFISSFKQATGTNTITIPNNAKYVRFSINSTNYIDNFQLEIGETATTYEPYVPDKEYILNNDVYEEFHLSNTTASNIEVNPSDTSNLNIWIETN